MTTKQKHVLITGGCGYVGSRLTPHLLNQGYQVSVIDLMLYGNACFAWQKDKTLPPVWQQNFRFIQGDIRDPDSVNDALTGVDTIIHLAAISNDPTGEIDEIMTRQVNFDAVGLLVKTAKAKGVQRFINASSSAVYGIKKENDVTENLETEPITVYAKYKALSEWIVNAAASENFCTVNLRPATICGVSPRQRFDLTVNKLTIDALLKKEINVHGGQQRRPNVGMEDIINIYTKLIEADKETINGETFNFGFENHQVIEIAEQIRDELSDLNINIKISPISDHRDYHISSNKILNQLNYQPVSSIKNEINNLRQAVKAGKFQDYDAPHYYNMQSMKLSRNNSVYTKP